MVNSFSERQSIVKVTSLNPKEMPLNLRNRLWNITQRYIDDFDYSRDSVIAYLWDRFFKEDISSLRSFDNYTDSGYLIDQIKRRFFELDWYRVYDFLEFILGIESYQKDEFIKKMNSIFIDEKAQYKIINEKVTPLISEVEVEEIEKAIESRYSAVSKHIQKALEFFCKRPTPDYQNSIKESISAIEALARIVLKKPSATLGELAEQLDIHPSLKVAIKKLYGWTSDEGGIRHAENGKELKIDEKEARYMLVQCSALVSYIVSKNEKK